MSAERPLALFRAEAGSGLGEAVTEELLEAEEHPTTELSPGDSDHVAIRHITQSQVQIRKKKLCEIVGKPHLLTPEQIPYSRRFSRDPIFVDGPSAKIMRSNFCGWPFLNRKCVFRLFTDLIFVVCQSTAKTVKIGSHENFRPYGRTTTSVLGRTP